MRIVDIREKTASIGSPIANAYIDFSKMTCSVVALVTDVMRDGQEGGRLWLQLERALRPRRADARAVHSAVARG
jgi:hypothetical protein